MSAAGIVTGLAIEAWVLRRARAAGVTAVAGDRGAAMRAAADLLDGGASALASLGVAGALATGLRPGDVVLAVDAVDAMGGAWACDAAWSATATRVLAGQGIGVIQGRILTAAAPILTRADKAAAGARHDAVAVDMESASVAAVAARRGVPFLAGRVIVDSAMCDVPAALADLMRPDGGISLVEGLNLLRRPPVRRAAAALARDFLRALCVLRRVAPFLVRAARLLDQK